MLRSILILSTVAATLFGSLGLPVYSHFCRMAAETTKAGCPMCSAEEDGLVSRHDDSDEHGRCCSDSVVNQRVDAGTMSRADLPMPLFAGIVAHVLFALDLPIAPTPDIEAGGHSPPALAARSQLTYLHNSTFLI